MDTPLHSPGHFPPAPGQVPDFRAHFRYVRILVTGLFQPLCAAASGSKPYRIQGVRMSFFSPSKVPLSPHRHHTQTTLVRMSATMTARQTTFIHFLMPGLNFNTAGITINVTATAKLTASFIVIYQLIFKILSAHKQKILRLNFINFIRNPIGRFSCKWSAIKVLRQSYGHSATFP